MMAHLLGSATGVSEDFMCAEDDGQQSFLGMIAGWRSYAVGAVNMNLGGDKR